MKSRTVFARILIVSMVVAACLVNGKHAQAQSAQPSVTPSPSFEVASVKPNRSGDMNMGIRLQPGRFVANGVPVRMLISLAYDVKDFQVTGGPAWIGSDRFDIDAKEEDSFSAGLEKLPPDDRRRQIDLCVQALLADRFKLKLNRESKELPVYALVVAKGGPKLQEAKPGDTYPNGFKGPDGKAHPGMMRIGPGGLTAQAVPIQFLVHTLSQQLGREVVDKTGLKGNYDLSLTWATDQNERGVAMGPGPGPGVGPGPGAPAGENAPPAPDPSGPSIFTAVQEQLGLKLEPAKGPVEILVINQIERPSED